MTGMSVPLRRRTYSVACAAVRVMRGSITIMLARLSSLPASTCWSDTGCASAGLPAMMTMVMAVQAALECVGAVELLAGQHVLERHRMRLGRIAAHDDHGLGVADVVVAVGHRAVAPGIGHARDGRRVANARLVIGVVGAPAGGDLRSEIRALVGDFRGAQPKDRIRTRLLADRHQLVADLVDGLIPADPVPLAVHHLPRVLEPA